VKLGTTGRYAVMAMVDLALQSHGKPLPLADIAAGQEISLSYLEQIFSKLRKGGLVKSVRGPGGGYLLARDVSKIRVSDIIVAVDKQGIRCAPGSPPGDTANDPHGLTYGMWEELENQIYLFLSSVSLEDVVEKRVLGKSGELFSLDNHQTRGLLQ
jgi:Rrf2 family iron-sulfur cluster assembly transcriptional regulator